MLCAKSASLVSSYSLRLRSGMISSIIFAISSDEYGARRSSGRISPSLRTIGTTLAERWRSLASTIFIKRSRRLSWGSGPRPP
jgi:hypothetical protein